VAPALGHNPPPALQKRRSFLRGYISIESDCSTQVAADAVSRWIPRPKGYRRQWARKQCFRNAGILADRGMGTYCEGFILSPPHFLFPIHHAWITLDGKTAIDPKRSRVLVFWYTIKWPPLRQGDLAAPQRLRTTRHQHNVTAAGRSRALPFASNLASAMLQAFSTSKPAFW
jgi:hypothetical protein